MKSGWKLEDPKRTKLMPDTTQERRERKIIQEPIRDRALDEIEKAIPDEVEGHRDYLRLASILDNLAQKRGPADSSGGQLLDFRTMASQVRSIADDEDRHRGILEKIKSNLTGISW